jgi:hypothetical protein
LRQQGSKARKNFSLIVRLRRILRAHLKKNRKIFAGFVAPPLAGRAAGVGYRERSEAATFSFSGIFAKVSSS